MNSMNKQKGLSGIAWLLIVVIVGIIVIMGLRLIPAYLGSMTVGTIMENAAKAPEATSAVEIRKGISKRLQVNDVDYLRSRDFEITREKGKIVISVKYERRVPFMGNIDFVVTFDKKKEVARG